MLRRILLIIVVGALSGPIFASEVVEKAIRSETAEEAVSLATAEVLAFISAGKSYADDDPEKFYRDAEFLLRPMIDFTRFARNVMGPYYKAATPQQRENFAESFKWSLVRTYALALVEFGDGEVAVLPPRRPPRNPNKVNVLQEITYQGRTYAVAYKMQRSSEQVWRIQNMVVEGVNVGINYKTQFASAMKDPQYGGDMDAVIAAWSDVLEPSDAADVSTTSETAPT